MGKHAPAPAVSSQVLRQDGRKPTKPEIPFIPLHEIKFGGDA